MGPLTAEESLTEEMTPEENQQLREEIAAEIEAEESGIPIVVKPPAEEAPPGDELPAEEPTEEDPFDGLNPELKDMFVSLTTQVETLTTTEGRLKQAESRIGSLQDQLHEAKKTIESEPKPTDEQVAEAAENKELWETLKEDFPEWGKAVGGQIAILRKEIGAGNKAIDIDALKADLAIDNETAIQSAVLTVFHPKWETVSKSKEYHEWLALQTDAIKTKHGSAQALDAIEVLDAYVDSRGTSKTAAEIALARRKRLKIAETPTGHKTAPIKSEADLTDAEYRDKVGADIWAED